MYSLILIINNWPTIIQMHIFSRTLLFSLSTNVSARSDPLCFRSYLAQDDRSCETLHHGIDMLSDMNVTIYRLKWRYVR